MRLEELIPPAKITITGLVGAGAGGTTSLISEIPAAQLMGLGLSVASLASVIIFGALTKYFQWRRLKLDQDRLAFDKEQARIKNGEEDI